MIYDISTDNDSPNLAQDIRSNFYIMDRLQDDRSYAKKLYAALCNNRWQKQDVMPLLADQYWSVSWRTAGAVVADLRNKDEGYLDFYCSGNEGVVDPEIEYDLGRLDWKVVPWEDGE